MTGLFWESRECIQNKDRVYSEQGQSVFRTRTEGVQPAAFGHAGVQEAVRFLLEMSALSLDRMRQVG